MVLCSAQPPGGPQHGTALLPLAASGGQPLPLPALPRGFPLLLKQKSLFSSSSFTEPHSPPPAFLNAAAAHSSSHRRRSCARIISGGQSRGRRYRGAGTTGARPGAHPARSGAATSPPGCSSTGRAGGLRGACGRQPPALGGERRVGAVLPLTSCDRNQPGAQQPPGGTPGTGPRPLDPAAPHGAKRRAPSTAWGTTAETPGAPRGVPGTPARGGRHRRRPQSPEPRGGRTADPNQPSCPHRAPAGTRAPPQAAAHLPPPEPEVAGGTGRGGASRGGAARGRQGAARGRERRGRGEEPEGADREPPGHPLRDTPPGTPRPGHPPVPGLAASLGAASPGSASPGSAPGTRSRYTLPLPRWVQAPRHTAPVQPLR
ncbi:basic salivary proline-rich protein 1-like [Dryobates pubescens]|uniref:basic salivary proline-rich protein 1-like n=1 Tax=Dryobates pubescens TaxID=118200 RepID=UPI0023B9D469|nr:basic salivary proline-rich protein 1-like [Dryobates pubescens]